jgi:hypothetical protein
MVLAEKTTKPKRPNLDWSTYEPGQFYDELISTPGNPSRVGQGIFSYLKMF